MPTAVAGPEIERLIQLLARLPGLGPRSARRAALFLIKKREQIMAPLAAALCCACLLTTPYMLDYDLVVLAVAIAFFVRLGLAHGFRDYEVSILSFAWGVPLVTRSLAGAVGLPLGSWPC